MTSDLITRLEGLTEPCGFTDELVAEETGWHSYEDEEGKLWWDGPASYQLCEAAPAVTASVDAVLELIERELPGYLWELGTCHVDGYAAQIIAEDAADWNASHGWPAVALLIAFLRAKES
jgi:hypothetical protein